MQMLIWSTVEKKKKKGKKLLWRVQKFGHPACVNVKAIQAQFPLTYKSG